MAYILTLEPDPPPGLTKVTLLHPSVMGVANVLGVQGDLFRHHLVVTKMWREYAVAGERRQGKLGNAYFHSNVSCIWSNQAHFMSSLWYDHNYVRQLLHPFTENTSLTLGFFLWTLNKLHSWYYKVTTISSCQYWRYSKGKLRLNLFRTGCSCCMAEPNMQTPSI